MRGWGHGSLAAAVAAALALGGCAGARTGEGRSCATAFQHADGVLRRTLARSVGAAAPGSVGAAVEQERLRARMDGWSEQHRREVVSECGSWTEERYRCVLGARSAQALAGCGLGDLVSSFTRDVLGSVAPLSPIITPSP